METLGEHAAIDFYVYNNDYTLFRQLLLNKATDYTHYVIIPNFLEGGERAYEIINTISPDKLVLVDKLVEGVKGNYSAIYQNFEKNIFTALEEAKPNLTKYHTLKIIFPEDSYFPDDILKGFCSFCREYSFNYKVVRDITRESIGEGEVYINLMEDDLVTLIERLIILKLEVGTQVGVISYNETPLKKIILNGITTISTDFRQMGIAAAHSILNNHKQQIEVPFHLTLRSSL